MKKNLKTFTLYTLLKSIIHLNYEGSFNILKILSFQIFWILRKVWDLWLEQNKYKEFPHYHGLDNHISTMMNTSEVSLQCVTIIYSGGFPKRHQPLYTDYSLLIRSYGLAISSQMWRKSFEKSNLFLLPDSLNNM